MSAWIGKAQRWAQERSDRLFTGWLETKAGKEWRAKQRRPRTRFSNPSSPYHYGFSLPGYLHDLIRAIGEGDEHTAKAIMLWE